MYAFACAVLCGIFILPPKAFSIQSKIKAHFLPPIVNQEAYLRSTKDLPLLDEFTLCTWVRPFSFNSSLSFVFNIGAISLKLLNDSPHEVASEFRIPTLELGTWNLVFGVRFRCSIKWSVPSWYHICLSLFIPSKHVTAYFFVNGEECKMTNIKEVHRLSQLNFDLQSTQRPLEIGGKNCWYGDIADLHIWNEVLSADQIREAGKCNGKRKIGNVFAWMRTPMNYTGSVVFKETLLCDP